MKKLVLIISLFSAFPILGQPLRLDSLVHYNLSFAHDNYISTYSYTTDRDFTINTRRFNGELATSFYKDSLLIRSFGDYLINEYQYDSLGRQVYVSITSPGVGTSHIYKSYWKDTKLITREEKVEFNNNDTLSHRIKLNSYDDQNRLLAASDSGFKDINGIVHSGNVVIEYDGDSLVIQDINIYNTGKGWEHSTTNTLNYPKILFGDTVCTIYSQWDVDTQTKESKCCTKYEWGKQGTKADWGYIAYRAGKIYGRISDYSETEHGYTWTGYECRSESGPDQWREDLKNRFQLTGTTCVSLNEYGLPSVDESFDVTGVLQNRTEYYYKEANDYSIKPLPESTNCPIIRVLNPDSIYYDVYGRRIKDVSSTQFLFEAGSNGMNRLLFVME